MSEHHSSIDTETMEQQPEKVHTKRTKSEARHLRRKRLILARREEKLSENRVQVEIVPETHPQVGVEKRNDAVFQSVNNSRTPNLPGDHQAKKETLAVSTEMDKGLLNEACKSTAPSSVDLKTNVPEKSRDQIKLEREAKKAAKAAAKTKGKQENSKVQQSASEETNVQEPQVVRNTSSNEEPLKEKSKSELRAERRAKQEAQRAAKQDALDEKKIKTVKNVSTTSSTTKPSATKPSATKPSTPKPSIPKLSKTKTEIVKPENLHEVNLFQHLYSERKLIFDQVNLTNSNIHPAIIRLGLRYADKVISGSNARCVALLAAVKQLIQDFERPAHADFTRGLEVSLQESIIYLSRCRPPSVSMQNAIKHLKRQMTVLPPAIPDDEAKTKLKTAIDQYIQEQILLADDAISLTIQTKISEGDVILTYGYSSLIHKILCDAYTANKKFRVIIVDARPWLEGKEQLRRLAQHGIECSYVLINALSSIMSKVNKVFLGAHAILANGAVMARIGTAEVAVMAKACNVPVLVACETHKSCERVQTDSIVHNEIGDADALLRSTCDSKKSSLTNWRSFNSLNLLNLTYDVTPAELVTAVVTELAILPCTSVPVILRIAV